MESQTCPVCDSPSWKEQDHPDGGIFRCCTCTHAFTDKESKRLETYDQSYFKEKHKNWFIHPNFKLFKIIQKIIANTNGKTDLLDVGCGQGDFLFFLAKLNPNAS